MDYRERILPSLGTTLALLGLVLATSFAVWVALGNLTAGVFALLGSFFALLWWRGAVHQIRVQDGQLRVNDAVIELQYIAKVTPLERDQWRDRRGVGFDPALFHAHKFWMKSGVEVTLHDPRDPHPGWLVGSHEPVRLAAAISQLLEE
jgi:hypothetical protein